MAQPHLTSEKRQERALLVGIRERRRGEIGVEESLDELAQLSRTAGADVADAIVCYQSAPEPSFLIGKGKTQQIAERVEAEGITTVIFDNDLTPAQGRNLENVIHAKVIDRTQLILDIFAQHAATREGRLQVELAQLEYLLPRLRRMWTHLERQRGGIGLRGPGEKQLEVDRRRIQERIARLRQDIEGVRRHRAEQRRGRRRHGWALVSVVGYTNAGKSTLLNALTGARVKAYNQLFATVDPTTRQIQLPNRQLVLMTDTVGFIRKLPHHLVDAFKATMEEVIEADVLLHVIDASHPQMPEQIAAVNGVLDEIGAQGKDMVCAMNKVDRPGARAAAARQGPMLSRAVPVSALTGQGLDRLCEELADVLKDRNQLVRLAVPLSESKLIAQLRTAANILSEEYEDDRVRIEARIPAHLMGKVRPYRESDPESPWPPADDQEAMDER